MDNPREDKNQNTAAEEEHPPLFLTWSRLYAAVLGSLLIYIILMLVFMKVFT
jgi:hypothetical protein